MANVRNEPRPHFVYLDKAITRNGHLCRYVVYESTHDRYYTAVIPTPLNDVGRNLRIIIEYNIGPSRNRMLPIKNPEEIFPTRQESWPICDNAWTSPSTFVKTQVFYRGDDLHYFNPRWVKSAALQELQALASLQKVPPHPNLCKFKGVVVDKSNLVHGLAYEKFDCDLETWVESGKTTNRALLDLVMKSIGSALDHMHKHGLVHCDVKPANIFVKARGKNVDHVVLGDFDSTHGTGKPLWGKRGTIGFCDESVHSGDPVHTGLDTYGLEKVRAWLKRQVEARDWLKPKKTPRVKKGRPRGEFACRH